MKTRTIILVGLAFFLIPTGAYPQGDLFEIKTPNVLVIFDTSSSMNRDPTNLNPDGSFVPVSKVRVFPNGEIDKSGTDPGATEYEFAGGGNHPYSKLYQAKLALREVIKNVQDVNLGFSTYAQRKTEKRRGYYYRLASYPGTSGTSPYYKYNKRYWRWNNYEDSWSITSKEIDKFKDQTGFEWSGSLVKVGFTYSIPHTFHNFAPNPPPPGAYPPSTYSAPITWRITNITFNAEYYYYTFSMKSDPHDHYEDYHWRTLTQGTDPNLPAQCSDFPKNDGTWKTYNPGDPEFDANPGYWCTEQFVPGSSGTLPYTQDEWAWQDSNGTICLDPYPGGAPGNWSLVGNCFDISDFYYPSGGPPNQPHTWSYFKIDGSGKWKDSDQPNPYFPADVTQDHSRGETADHNHWFFVNLPTKEADKIPTRDLIVSYLDLTPQVTPQSNTWTPKRYYTKLPFTGSVTSNTVESFYTPLAASLNRAYGYYYSYIWDNWNSQNGDAASQAGCRENFVILLTDGLESCEMKSPLEADYQKAIDAAKALYEMKKGSVNTPVKTFVIAFGKDIKGNETLNAIAQEGKTGSAQFAENLDELKKAFTNVFKQIAGSYGRSNPVVSMTRDRLCKGFFELPGWKGNLVEYKLDQATGKIVTPNTPEWYSVDSANPSSYIRGTAWTWIDAGLNSPKREFSEANLTTLKPYLILGSDDIDGDSNPGQDGDAKAVINFTLDPGYGGGAYKGLRASDWKLADIYHSTPVIVGEPPFSFLDAQFPQKYSVFKTNNKDREARIYVGTNGGMLQAFDEKTGKEKFTIIPKNLLGKLKEMRINHEYYVDSSAKAYDVFFWGDSTWRTIIVTGERGGGNYYFAVDVTTPDNPEILWELTEANMGKTWSRPDIGVVMDGGKKKFVAFVGAGYAEKTENDIGNYFYVIDIETGTLLKKFKVGSDPKNRVVAAPTAFDADDDGLMDYVYFGDIQGTLWKVSSSDPSDPDISKWTIKEFFKPVAGKREPIFYAPAVTRNNQGKVLIFFGTGDELDLTDMTKYNYFWEIEDQGDTGKDNWFVQLEVGEKILSSPSVANRVVYFTSWLYKGLDVFCGAGEGRIWGLTITGSGITGGLAALYLDIDTGAQLGSPEKFFKLDNGIPSAPVVTNGMIYVSSNLSSNKVRTIPIPSWGLGRLKSWREVF